LGTSLGAVCADIAVAAFEVPGLEIDAWLGDIVALVAEDVPAGVVVSAAIVEPVGKTRAWETHHFAMAGAVRPELASALEREAREGYPHDDVAFHAGQRGENPRPTWGARPMFMADDAWIHSAYAAFRRPLGLHEFARAVVPLQELDEPRTLLLQIDLLQAGAEAGDWEVGLVGGVAPAIVRAYHRRFVALREHREEIKRRLTPAQRKIVPLLVEGLSESQVAARVGRSAHTIHDHTKTIYHALGVSNRLQLRDLWFGRRERAGRDMESESKPQAKSVPDGAEDKAPSA
jgi:DNA-binding CsgD family transcriptional regulator